LLVDPDRKNGINLIPSRYHWDQLDAKVIVLDINFPVRTTKMVHYSKIVDQIVKIVSWHCCCVTEILTVCL
jgi:hypothetical protein